MRACRNQRPGLEIPLAIFLVHTLIMNPTPSSASSSSSSSSSSSPSSSNSNSLQQLLVDSSYPVNTGDFHLHPADSQVSSNNINSQQQQHNSTTPTYRDDQQQYGQQRMMSCQGGLLTFELATGFIYKPSSAETLAMLPSTLQLTDCLESCLQNFSCLAINFEMGLCVLLSSSAKQNPNNLYSSQFPVFTIYAEKKCLLQGDPQAAKQRNKCQRAWTFERVAGFEMKSRPRRRLKLASKELCMEACLTEREFECRSANWYRINEECTLSDQDRHSVSQSEPGDQHINSAHFLHLYGPSNLTYTATSSFRPTSNSPLLAAGGRPPYTTPPPDLYQNYYLSSESRFASNELPDRLRLRAVRGSITDTPSTFTSAIPGESTNSSINQVDQSKGEQQAGKERNTRQLLMSGESLSGRLRLGSTSSSPGSNTNRDQPLDSLSSLYPAVQYAEPAGLLAQAPVDYLENNCVYEPNKLCEFRKIQNRILKTVDSIYQDVNSLEECKQKCLTAPYRCYSFDYGDTSDKVCRTSHLDQASLLAVREPYLEVMGAITYELAACFTVTIACRAKEMVAQVSSSKSFKGRIYAKSRPSTCVNDVRDSLHFELAMRYHDPSCDVRATSNSQQGVFSNDIVIQHHDRIVTTQDVGLSVYCQYGLGNRIITNNVDLAIDRIAVDDPSNPNGMESKTQPPGRPSADSIAGPNSPLTITSLATTVVRSPNVTMRITNMNGQPVTSATVGDRLALLFEIKEKTSPFGIFVREIIAMDGKQLLAAANKNNNNGMAPGKRGYHYGSDLNQASSSSLPFNRTTQAGNLQEQGALLNENTVESLFQANKANSVLFIDADGCPTDVNIMGPLVKMDPSGHRILAPFDAFKFPSSDMVFFRAVVTSCVSECRPAVCSGPGGSSLQQSATATSSGSTPTTAGFYSSTETALDTSGITTTQLGAVGAEAHSAPPSTSTGSSRPEMSPSSTPTPLNSAQQPSRNLSSSREPTWSSGDALTTTPSFGSSTERDRTVAAASVADPAVWAGQSAATLASAAGSIVTTTTGSPLVSTHNGPGVDQLSAQQRAQILKLLELRLKQQLAAGSLGAQGGSSNASSSTEMAQLYANFLANVMLNGLGASSSSPAADLLSATQTVLNYPSGTFFRPRDEPESERVLARSTLPAGEESSSHAQTIALADHLETLLMAQSTGANMSGSTQQQQLARILEQSLTPTPIDPNQRTTPRLESTRSIKAAGEPTSVSSAAAAAAAAANRYRSQQSQVAASSKPTKSPQEEERKRRANLQALADSYLGAYQSLGRRRRRRKRSNSESLNDQLVDYVYLEHSVTPSAVEDQQSIRFTKAAVEMYHEKRDERASSARRRKRRDLDGSYYDMDELVVQAIKIVDRLQFVPEGNSTGKKLPSSPRLSLARSSLVRALQNTNDSKHDQLDEESIMQHDEHQQGTGARNWSSSSAISMIIVAASFVFIQIFLVIVCLMEWNQRRVLAASASRRRQQQQVLAAAMAAANTLSRCSSVNSAGSSTLSTGETSVLSQYARQDPRTAKFTWFGHRNSGGREQVMSASRNSLVSTNDWPALIVTSRTKTARAC